MPVHLAAIGVIVSDIERSAAFYRELGLAFPEPADPDGHGHAEATAPGGLRFMLDTVNTIESFDENWTPPSGGHRVGLAFECDSPADVDATYERMLAAGASPYKEPWDAFWQQRYAQITDLDGNVIDLFANLS
jgi:uncharacterized glyoxalase superfamily protein PhnB